MAAPGNLPGPAGRRRAAVVVTAFAALVGCASVIGCDRNAGPAVDAPPPPRTVPPRPATPAGAAGPFAATALAPARQFRVAGRIEERLSAGSYVYLKVRPTGAPADVWVVLMTSSAPPTGAATVDVLVVARAATFHSRRLGRDFSDLLFATASAGPAAASTTPPIGAPTPKDKGPRP